ncbi:S8 family serine peptidase, partial [Chloroflexota bacterium]
MGFVLRAKVRSRQRAGTSATRALPSTLLTLFIVGTLLAPPVSAVTPFTAPFRQPDPAPAPGLPATDPGPRVEPGARESGDLRDALREAEPAEAAEILRAYAREKGIPLDERPPMPDDPDFSMRLPAGERTPAPGVEPSLQAKLPALQDGGAEIPLLVQFNHRLSLGEMIELYELGLMGLGNSVGELTHVVLVPAKSLGALSEKPYVRWVGEYRPAHKYKLVDPSSKGDGWAFVYPIDKDREQYRSDLAALGVAVSDYDETVGLYYALVGEERMLDVAKLGWVLWIEREPAEVLLQTTETFEPDDSRELVGTFNSFRTGAGVTVGVRDNGILDSHVDFTGKIDALSHTDLVEEHGTHVTGIILAEGALDIAGEHDARGVAPDASVLFQRFGTGVGYSYLDALVTWESNGVQLSNHSWGFTNDWGYDSDTQN